MTTPIMNVLDIAQQPPFVVGWQELDKFHRAITALYEQQTKDGREAFLIDDCLSLILRHRMFGGTPQAKIQIIERNEQIQGSIEEIARLLLSVARDLNTRLPDSFIEQCRNSTEESASRFYDIISEAYITPAWEADNKADNSEKGTGMGNNATANPETPPATQETPKVAVLQPYTPNSVGRPTEDNFADTIADKYTIQGKADMIQKKLQRAISGMTEPMAIFALFVECFNKDILKQCPNHKQALSLIEDVAMREAYKRQWHNKQRNVYFDKDEAYLYLNETDSEQDNAINRYILQAEPTVKDLLLLLEPPATKKKARKGA